MEKKFWNWFKKNENKIFNFEKDKENIFDEISFELSKIDENLTFEFSYIKNNKREFVISAGGIISSFPYVEKLYNNAPKMKRWKIIKFRPRRKDLNTIDFADRIIKPDDVNYLLFFDEYNNKIGVRLFFDGFSVEERDIYAQFGYLFLDEIVGEYDVETKIGCIYFESTTSKFYKHSKPIHKMRKEFDNYFNN